MFFVATPKVAPPPLIGYDDSVDLINTPVQDFHKALTRNHEVNVQQLKQGNFFDSVENLELYAMEHFTLKKGIIIKRLSVKPSRRLKTKTNILKKYMRFGCTNCGKMLYSIIITIDEISKTSTFELSKIDLDHCCKTTDVLNHVLDMIQESSSTAIKKLKSNDQTIVLRNKYNNQCIAVREIAINFEDIEGLAFFLELVKKGYRRINWNSIMEIFKNLYERQFRHHFR